MQEHEDRGLNDNCGHCKFYKPADLTQLKGDCTRRPRMYQKHNDKTEFTNWCQYYEGVEPLKAKDRDYDEEAEAVPETSAPELPAFENRVPEPRAYTPVEAFAVVRELKGMASELEGFRAQLAQQLVTAAETDNTMLMVETKGLVRAVAVVMASVKGRMDALLPTMGKEH